MTLTKNQTSILDMAIRTYSYPAVYYHFPTSIQRHAKNMRHLEGVIQKLLCSTDAKDTKDGLANILYWGYANVGFRNHRVNRFRKGVNQKQIGDFQLLITRKSTPTLHDIQAIGMPQFSHISFISKIIMFLDPVDHCVLDLQLSKIGNIPGPKALNKLKVSSGIGVTRHNASIYKEWCEECKNISKKYFKNKYRAVDIERGFFNLVQNGQLHVAQQIYSAA